MDFVGCKRHDDQTAAAVLRSIQCAKITTVHTERESLTLYTQRFCRRRTIHGSIAALCCSSGAGFCKHFSVD